MKDERTRADGKESLATLTSLRHEFKQLGIHDLCSSSLATGDKQVVQCWTVIEGHVWIDRESLGTGDGLHLFRYHQAWRSTSHLLPHREHLPGAHEVKFLDLREDEYAEGHRWEPVGSMNT